MKHENNFLLYSLGSAFLLVATMMHLSFSGSSQILAQVGRVEVVQKETSDMILYPITEVHFSELSGNVSDENTGPVKGVQIYLFETKDFPQTQPVASLFTDELGNFVFERVPEGRYDIVIEAQENYSVISPNPFILGFENSRYGYQVTVEQGENKNNFKFILSQEKTSQ